MMKSLRFLMMSALLTWITFFSGSPMTSVFAQKTPCVQIYYDQSKDPHYWLGKAYATFLQNLMGHFPEYQQIIGPIETYKSGDIERCHATFYIGSYFDNQIPADFFKDFQSTQKSVAWLGYNVWNFPKESLVKLWGHEYTEITKVNNEIKDAKGQPTFFKNILYKNEVFFKYGKFKKGSQTEFLAPFEMISLKVPEEGTNTSYEILAEAEHNGTKEKLPYALRNKNKYYVADVPFSFIHEADRYLVFSDLLFDILGEQPKQQKRLALIRLEDIHPLVPISYLYSATNALKAENVPIHLSLIPIFFDPLFNYTRKPDQEFVTLTQVPEFMQFLKEMKKMNSVIIWHGSTHQTGLVKNPHSGVSGDDFEFWDANNNRILPEDSSDYVLDRLDAGFYDMLKADIVPNYWLTPHYQASPLDYFIFGRVMHWNIGRVIYFNHTAKLPSEQINPAELIYNKANNTPEKTKLRYEYFKQFEVTPTNDQWYGQYFPYEIYGDIYGQKLIPENLGNSQPTENEHVVQPRSVDEIIADAKRNLVIRDAWASVFYHVQLMNIDENGGTGHYPGDPEELLKLVRGIKALGYEFVNLDQFHLQNKHSLRPQPIYQENSAQQKGN